MLRSIIILMAALGMAAQATRVHAQETARPLRILFIGNSFVHVNDMPGILRAIARASSPARVVETGIVSAGRASLEQHWNTGRAQKEIQSGRWDYVVLQELFGVTMRWPEVQERHVALFDALIKASGARTVFFVSWVPTSMRLEHMTLEGMHNRLARDTGALVAPVGTAWLLAEAEHREASLFAPDGIHASDLGSYLTACTFYRLLVSPQSECSSPSREYAVVSEADRAVVQAAVARALMLQ